MHSTAWQELIARVPSHQHNRLVLMTNVGIELLIQDIIRLQPDYMAIKGRVSGTSDAGRMYFVPYGNITFMGITKLVSDAEVEEIFAPVAPPPAESVVETPAVEEPNVPVAEPFEEPESAELEPVLEVPRTAPTPTKFPNRAELLERIRSRSQPVPSPKPSK